jgi:hypothetical protein
MTDTLTRNDEWTDLGATRLPVQYRDRFLAVLAGLRTGFADQDVTPQAPRWRHPNGSFPMSPGMALESIINEFNIPARAVCHNLAWEAHDTTGQPGYFGDFTCTYTVLGVQTKRQRLWFLDGGASIVAVLIQSFPTVLDAPEGE